MGMQSRAAFATPVAALVSPGAEVAEHDAGSARDTGVGVRRMTGHLFVSDVDELDGAALECSEDGDVGVATKAEDVTHPAVS